MLSVPQLKASKTKVLAKKKGGEAGRDWKNVKSLHVPSLLCTIYAVALFTGLEASY